MSERRDAVIEGMKAKLDELNADLDRWEARAENAKAEGRERYVERVEALRRKRDELGKKLTDVRESAGGAWEEIARGFEEAWRALKKGFDEARAELDRDEPGRRT